MEKIKIQLESRFSNRGHFGRPLVLMTISAVMITGVFAVLFYTSNNSVEFGQSITPIQSCAYAQGAGSIVLTPSSTYDASFNNTGNPGFELSGLTESLQSGYAGCQGKVLSTMFLDANNAPIPIVTYHSQDLTTFQINNGTQVVSNANAGYADLVAAHLAALCTTDGKHCYKLSGLAALGTFTASNLGQSVPGDSINLGFSLSSKVDAAAVQQVVMQTLSGFTSPLL
jgi:hypothetical protein